MCKYILGCDCCNYQTTASSIEDADQLCATLCPECGEELLHLVGEHPDNCSCIPDYFDGIEEELDKQFEQAMLREE